MALTTGLRTLTVQVVDPESNDSVACYVFITSDAAGQNVVGSAGAITPTQISSNGGPMNFTPQVNIASPGTYYAWLVLEVNGNVYAVYSQGQVTVVAAANPWTYGTPAIDINWQVGTSSFYWVRYRVTITNPNPFPLTQYVSVLCKGISGPYANQMMSVSGINSPYQITIPANGTYAFDSCLIENITKAGYAPTGHMTFCTLPSWIVEEWITATDGSSSTPLET
jgi:plastocyanin